MAGPIAAPRDPEAEALEASRCFTIFNELTHSGRVGNGVKSGRISMEALVFWAERGKTLKLFLIALTEG